MTTVSSFRISSAALVLLLAACSPDSEKTLVERATAEIAKGDAAAAAIHLRSALQQSPNSARARFLFGKLLLDGGDVENAAIELRKARDAGHSAEEIAPLLALILLAQGKYADVVGEYQQFRVSDAKLQGDLAAVVASAHVALGNIDRAQQTVDAELPRSAASAPLRLVQARLLGLKGDVDGALSIVKEVVGNEPTNANAWRLQGDLLFLGKRDATSALVAYQKVLGIRAGDASTQAQVIWVHLANKDLKSAQEQLNAFSKAAPNHPAIKGLAAHIAIQSGDHVRARELLAQLLKGGRDDPQLLLHAAAAEMKAGDVTRAEAYLKKVLSTKPDVADARKMLASIQLRRGEAGFALETLQPLIRGTSPDPVTLRLAAEAHLLVGDTSAAEAFFTRLKQLRPDDVNARTALALTRLAKGDISSLTTLEEISASDDKSILADLSLINVLMRRKDFDAALRAIDRLDQKLPGKPMGADLRGRVLLFKGDSGNARKSFQEALARDPVYFPAASVLAQMDVNEGKPADARKRLESLLKADPKNPAALTTLAALRYQDRADPTEVAELLGRAVDARPSDPAIRVLLVDHWLRSGRANQAVLAAQDALATSPDAPALLDALGRAHLASGDVSQAIATFGKLAFLQPKSELAQLRLAEAQLRANRVEAAETALHQALKASPESLAAQRALMMMAVQAKDPNKALRLARSVQQQRPKHGIGDILEGDIHAAFQSWDSAIKSYRAALPKQGGSLAATRLFQALGTSNRKPEADKFATDWLRQYPSDTRLRTLLADNAMKSGDLATAEKHYSDLVRINSADLMALNNLAWVLAKSGKAGSVEMAKRAVALSPRNASALDTLGFALAATNRLPEALEASKSAVELAPLNSQLRFNLAKLYLKSDNKTAAKAELEKLASLGSKFSSQDEVNQLLKGL